MMEQVIEDAGNQTSRVEPVAVSPRPSASGPAVTVYYVHGTWAPEASWTGSNSAITKAIRVQIPSARVKRIVWRGRNRQLDRDEAAKCLANELDADPDTPAILIGHSHGGNVAHRALLLANTGDQVQGVVCLNTPFFTVLRRNFQARLATGFWFWTWGGAVAVLLVADASLVLFSLAAAVWMAGVFLAIWANNNPEVIRDRQTSLVRRINRPVAPHLCLTSYDDEAFSSLSSVEAICNLPHLLVSRWLLWPYMVAAVVLIWIGVLPPVLSSGSGWWWELAAFGSSVYAWAAVFYFIPLFLAYPAAIVSFGLQGIWHPMSAYLVRSVVTLTPHSNQPVQFRDYEVEGGDGLAHSLLYKDKEACEEVAVWMQDRLNDAHEAKHLHPSERRAQEASR